MHEAIGGNNLASTIKLLLDYGADPNAKQDQGMTPLHWLIHLGKADLTILQYLLEYGADINARDNQQDTPLVYARKHLYWNSEKHKKFVRFLKTAGAKR